MTAGLAITGVEVDRAGALLDARHESAGTAAAVPSGNALLLSTIQWFEDDVYEQREPRRLELRSHGWAPVMIEIARSGNVPVFVHTHPGGPAAFSQADDIVDTTIAEELMRIAGCREVASIIIGGTSSEPTVSMRRSVDGTLGPPETVRVAGPIPRLIPPRGDVSDSLVFDRQDRVYGAAGRRVLEQLTLGIVGAGGTGSPTHEQALRIGIGTVISIDDDVVTESTPTRGYGTGMADIGSLKVDAMARLNDHIGLGSDLRVLPINVRDPAAEEALAGCDVIFGCTDGHYSRIVLNRLAYYHLVPVIDLGVLVTADEAGSVRIDERITIVGPGTGCLMCGERISPAHARAENMDPELRRAEAAEGYVPDIDEPAPAVVTYTTMTSSFAMTTLLHRLFGIGDNRHTELLIQPNLNRIRTNVIKPRDGCAICSDRSSWGQGFTEPRLGIIS